MWNKSLVEKKLRSISVISFVQVKSMENIFELRCTLFTVFHTKILCDLIDSLLAFGYLHINHCWKWASLCLFLFFLFFLFTRCIFPYSISEAYSNHPRNKFSASSLKNQHSLHYTLPVGYYWWLHFQHHNEIYIGHQNSASEEKVIVNHLQLSITHTPSLYCLLIYSISSNNTEIHQLIHCQSTQVKSSITHLSICDSNINWVN